MSTTVKSSSRFSFCSFSLKNMCVQCVSQPITHEPDTYNLPGCWLIYPASQSSQQCLPLACLLINLPATQCLAIVFVYLRNIKYALFTIRYRSHVCYCLMLALIVLGRFSNSQLTPTRPDVGLLGAFPASLSSHRARVIVWRIRLQHVNCRAVGGRRVISRGEGGCLRSALTIQVNRCSQIELSLHGGGWWPGRPAAAAQCNWL